MKLRENTSAEGSPGTHSREKPLEPWGVDEDELWGLLGASPNEYCNFPSLPPALSTSLLPPSPFLAFMSFLLLLLFLRTG